MSRKNIVYCGDNLPILRRMADGVIDLIYIDPPFNTGKRQTRTQVKVSRSTKGDRKGFNGQKYKTIELGTKDYLDIYDDYRGFLTPRLEEAYRVLSPTGTMYFHIDYREVHYCKILLDQLFGRDSFLNEIIWAYDYGGKPKNKWPPKHDNILMYVKDPRNYTFNVEDIDRIPYMAPGLVGPEKAAKGKLPTDTWWHTIVPTMGKEKTGYPTQKPRALLDRMIRASSDPGDLVLDFFAGSGTTGESCLMLNRRFILIDNSEQAMQVMAQRFSAERNIEWVGFNPVPYQVKK